MKPLRVVLIAAVSRNGVLASGGKIPWHLPRDVAHFRARTAGHWLLLGRTTYEQMTGWFKPGHVPVVLTGQSGYTVPGGFAVSSVEEAVALAAGQGAAELIVCGGGQVYAAALPTADEIILTKVDMDATGDVRFPGFSGADWKVVEQDTFPVDGDNAWGMTICRMQRVSD